ADVEDQIRLELEQNFEVCRVAAAGQPPNLGLVATARAQKLALRGIVAAGPADEQIGRKRVEQDRSRRPACEHAFDLFGNRNRAPARIGDGRARKARRQDRGGDTAQERSAIEQHHEMLISIFVEILLDSRNDNSIFVEIWKSQTSSPHWPLSPRTTASMSIACWCRRDRTVCRQDKWRRHSSSHRIR